jgi:HEAT repeat protein
MFGKTMMKKTLATIACSFALLAVAPSAQAGNGGSAGVIRSAIRSNNADAIISALEQSENILCNADCHSMVMELLENDDYRIRQVAAWWFARRPAQMKELGELATAWLTVGNSTEARNGADILGTFGYAKYIDVLTEAAAKTSFSGEARAHIIKALGDIANKRANAVVATAMSDSDPQVRLSAVTAWKNMLKQEGAAPVAALVTDSDVSVRRAAIATVGTFREATARIDLETVLSSDADPAARRNAAWALGRIGDSASREVLQAAVDDESSLVRLTAKNALRQLR